MTDLSSYQYAKARANAYHLFGDLFLHGVTAHNLVALQKVPAFSADESPLLPASFDPDQAAADHYQLFQHNIFPYQNIFLDTSNLMGGEETERIGNFYREANFTPTHEPDHMGQALLFLSFLCHAEADAWRDNLPSEAARMQVWQNRFLTEQLLRWMPAFIIAVHSHHNPLFSTVADWLWQTVAEHSPQDSSPAVALPTPPELLADDKTSIKDIANYLVTTPYCGVFLSRDNIGELARALNMPRGFGDRGQMMANLFRAAAGFEEMPAFIQQLIAVLDGFGYGYTNFIENYPHLASFVAPWQKQLSQTKNLLREIGSKSHENG